MNQSKAQLCLHEMLQNSYDKTGASDLKAATSLCASASHALKDVCIGHGALESRTDRSMRKQGNLQEYCCIYELIIWLMGKALSPCMAKAEVRAEQSTSWHA